LNKLAVLAFALLLFFSTMLWYLASGSLNDYLKSQIQLQGHYYSGQKTTIALTDYSANTGTAQFKQLNLANASNYHTQHALIIDEVRVEVSPQQPPYIVTQVNKITINNLSINIEQKIGSNSNIDQLIDHISLKLANDYPEQYPAISAKIYAAKNPTLNAEQYAQNNPQAGPMIEHTSPKKKRGKPQSKIIISAITIKTLTLNTIQGDAIDTIQKHNIDITAIGGSAGFVSNQLGGELLLTFLSLANQ